MLGDGGVVLLVLGRVLVDFLEDPRVLFGTHVILVYNTYLNNQKEYFVTNICIIIITNNNINSKIIISYVLYLARLGSVPATMTVAVTS